MEGMRGTALFLETEYAFDMRVLLLRIPTHVYVDMCDERDDWHQLHG